MSTTQNEKTFHTLTLNQKVYLAIAFAFLILVVFPVFTVVYYKFAVLRPNQSDKDITFEVKGGDSLYQVSTKLYEVKAINSEFLFRIYMKANGLDTKVQSGIYKINAGSSIVDIAAMVQRGINDKKITFLEGWRAEEYALVASKNFSGLNYTEFALEAKKYEGYLFPDTYEFAVGTSEEEMVAKLVRTFDSKSKGILTEANLKKVGLTKNEVVVLASIIEREVRDEDQKAVVAGILLKRLKDKTLLGADATTQYMAASKRFGCDLNKIAELVCPPFSEKLNSNLWWPNDLTVEELELKMPYNTRAVVGLPPTPISNPGLSSLSAVVNAAETDYYYYLHDNNGNIYYGKTLEEHNLNIQKYLN